MISISLCMIVKNESLYLGRCLDSIKKAVDEIIIIDTGSTDNTKQIALNYTDLVFDFVWQNDFSLARNFSFLKATCDYILWLDADDIILKKDLLRLMRLKRELKDIDTVLMKYNLLDEMGEIALSFFRERLVKRIKGFIWKEPVHEYISTFGSVLKSDICITHLYKNKTDSKRNLRIYKEYLRSGNRLSKRGQYYYARELKDNGYYNKAIREFDRLLNSFGCFYEDGINACIESYKCHVLLNKREKGIEYLFKSFIYDNPTPEACCYLGYYFKERGSLKQAIFWFNSALNYKNDKRIGFFNEDFKKYIPCIELAVCYFNLNDRVKAAHFNEKAAKFKPDSYAVKHNRNIFSFKE